MGRVFLALALLAIVAKSFKPSKEAMDKARKEYEKAIMPLKIPAFMIIGYFAAVAIHSMFFKG